MPELDATTDYINLEEKRLVELMKNKAKTKNHANLGDSVLGTGNTDKEALSSLFEKMHEGKISETPVTNPNAVNRLDEKAAEPVPVLVPVTAPVITEIVKEKELKVKDDFNLDTKFEEKIEEGKHDIPTESLTNPKVKDAVSKLRNMAAALRGESIQTTQNMEKPLIVRPVDGQNSTLMEGKVVEEPSYSLKKLNTMLYRAQDKFNQTGNGLYESIADELSSVIAEALLSNKKSVAKSKISGPTRNF
jgi:hypothetical protein